MLLNSLAVLATAATALARAAALLLLLLLLLLSGSDVDCSVTSRSLLGVAKQAPKR